MTSGYFPNSFQWVGFVLVLSACGGSPRSSDSRWLHVALERGDPEAGFQVTISRDQGSPSTLVCPAAGAPQESARCSAAGFDVLSSEPKVDVLVRARGSAFASGEIALDTALALEPLQAAEHTVDYATRFDGDLCSQDLQDFALPLLTELGESRSVKFYIADLKTRPRVYFQNTKLHQLHFDFAQAVLGLHETATEFALETYSGKDRAAMAGTLVYYPSVRAAATADGSTVDAPWTLNFFSSDDLAPEQVRFAQLLIEERLTCLRWLGQSQRLVYLPAGSLQERQTADDASAFARQGLLWMNHQALFGGISQQALNPGVAFGTLKRMTPDELAGSVVSFRDILLLTRLPNELPIVAGTITEEFQTPLAHVNLAARTRGTPNLAYPGAFADPSVSSLLGKLVRFEVAKGEFSIRAATLAEAETFWSARQPEPYVPLFDASSTGIPSFDEVGFADSVRVGVKAANLAELSHALADNAPAKGLAIPFHYYQAHLDRSRTSPNSCDAAGADCTSTGRDPGTCQQARTLCLPPGSSGESLSEYVERVIVDATFKQDTALRDAVLENLRYFIEHSAVEMEFGELLDRRVAEVFGNAKVKLRSSTNCEDLPEFSGAGLYNSYAARSGSADSPSRVVTKVFASAWSFRGFEERSYWNIDHRAVRMGCAINEAFSNELANGVLVTENVADPGVDGMYVNVQKGEESVTNPSNGALPEVFSAVPSPEGIQVVRTRFSSLSPQAPLLTESEIQILYRAAAKARSHFAPFYELDADQLILDMEFKLTPERKIVFKQARPYFDRAR